MNRDTVWMPVPDAPESCGTCGRVTFDGTWPLGVYHNRLALICPICDTVVASVVTRNPAP
jgi:hypothetical protein